MANRGREGLPIFKMPLIGDATTVSGRLVKERRASDQAQRRATSSGISMDYTVSTFPGSREGLLIGSSAYEAMSPHMKALVDGFAWIRTMYYSSFNRTTPEVSTIGEVTEMTQIGNSLVQYLLFKADSEYSSEGTLPDLVADIEKSCAGLRIGASNLLNLGTYKETDEALTGAEMYSFVNDTRQLLSPDGVYACAAPENVIVAGYDVFGRGLFGDATRSDLQTLFPDFGRLKTFSQVLLKYNDLITDFARDLRLTFLLEESKVDGGQLTDSERRKIVIDRSIRVLSNLNDLQRTGNISLGRQVAPNLTGNDLAVRFLGPEKK